VTEAYDLREIASRLLKDREFRQPEPVHAELADAVAAREHVLQERLRSEREAAEQVGQQARRLAPSRPQRR
jgi:hypothetical protein